MSTQNPISILLINSKLIESESEEIKVSTRSPMFMKGGYQCSEYRSPYDIKGYQCSEYKSVYD